MGLRCWGSQNIGLLNFLRVFGVGGGVRTELIFRSFSGFLAVF